MAKSNDVRQARQGQTWYLARNGKVEVWYVNSNMSLELLLWTTVFQPSFGLKIPGNKRYCSRSKRKAAAHALRQKAARKNWVLFNQEMFKKMLDFYGPVSELASSPSAIQIIDEDSQPWSSTCLHCGYKIYTAEKYCDECAADIQKRDDLIAEGYSSYQAEVMSGLRDPDC